MQRVRRGALVSCLGGHERLVEIGIGQRMAVAGALVQAGCSVTATDIRDCAVPPGVRFARDDVTDPDHAVYADADAIYGLNLPPELQRPARDLARDVGAPLYFTTLGGDPAVVPVSREPIPGGTVYLAARTSGPARTGGTR